jgi:hypothetical protein
MVPVFSVFDALVLTVLYLILVYEKLHDFAQRTWQRYLSRPKDARENGSHNARRACGVSISEFSHGFLAYVIVMRVNLYEDTRNRDDRRTFLPAPFTLTNVS